MYAKIDKWNDKMHYGTMTLENGSRAIVDAKAFQCAIAMNTTYVVIVRRTPGKMHEVVSANLP